METIEKEKETLSLPSQDSRVFLLPIGQGISENHVGLINTRQINIRKKIYSRLILRFGRKN